MSSGVRQILKIAGEDKRIFRMTRVPTLSLRLVFAIIHPDRVPEVAASITLAARHETTPLADEWFPYNTLDGTERDP
ncbi:MAG TPA: hypothetical protein VII30_07955 [Gemmatimonadaceae bacterium]